MEPIYDQRKDECLREGKEVEYEFGRVAVSHGWTWRFGTEYQDKVEHIDLFMTFGDQTLAIQVKGLKAVSRKIKQEKLLWLERHGDYPSKENNGWIYGGKAALIAFEMRDSFWLIERETLRDIYDELVPADAGRCYIAEGAEYRLYSRPGHPRERTSLIEAEHIVPHLWAIWPKQ